MSCRVIGAAMIRTVRSLHDVTPLRHAMKMEGG